MKILFVLFLILGGCVGTKIKDFDSYAPSPLLQAEFMPPEKVIEGHVSNVLVMPFDNNGNRAAEESSLGVLLAIEVENTLTNDKLVHKIDRKADELARYEMALAEMMKGKPYRGPELVDYIITGNVSKAEFTSRYTAGSHFFDSKKGTYVYIPPRWNYKSIVAGNLNVFDLERSKILFSVPFEGVAMSSENSKIKSNPKTKDELLMKEAASKAINEIQSEVKNYFAQVGYIIDRREYKKKTIFRISMGSSKGMRRGLKLAVISRREETNDLTGETEIVDIKIADAFVTDVINENSSWIVIKDKKDIEKIRQGDIVRANYSKSFFAENRQAIGTTVLTTLIATDILVNIIAQ